MAIKTPNILPGEPGYISRKEKTLRAKNLQRKRENRSLKKEMNVGKIRIGGKGFRLGRPVVTPKQDKRYPIWRYSKKIGEIFVSGKKPHEEITLTFNRLGGIGNYKHLIQDADFQLEWAIREQELLITQRTCFVCSKKLSKTAKPNLYHHKMWKLRAKLLEDAAKVPLEVVSGKLSIEEGWKKFNTILESGNRYFMGLKDTVLVCSTCAKAKNVDY